MKQAKKIFTRMLINNWGGISHKVLRFHEYVNLFSGKSGSGKSTVMDAIQVVLYGSLSPSFLNKAADDARNRRSVLSYLRGAQKDGTANREHMDFCSHIVLEVVDTGTKITTCFGAAFEVGRSDQDIKKYTFFSHSGPLPEDEYLDGDGVPYSIARIRRLTEERRQSSWNRGRGDVNRLYPSNEAYINTLCDVILGYVEPRRLSTMEKSAIALRMTNGTGQFIRDYMFPRSKEDTVSTISDQLGAYREIKERVDDLERRIGLLDAVHEAHGNLTKTRADIVRGETVLRIIEIEGQKARLEARTQDRDAAAVRIGELEAQKLSLQKAQEELRSELVEVEASLKASDYGQKRRELEEVERTAELLAGNSRQWRNILEGLAGWTEDGPVSDYVSNPALLLIEEFRKGQVTEEKCGKLRQRLAEAREAAEEELRELGERKRALGPELREKKETVEDLRNDRKHYEPGLKQARAKLEDALKLRYGKRIPVYVLADLFDVADEEWKNAVEGRMGRVKFSLVTAPEYAVTAAELFRGMSQYEDAELIDTAAVLRDQPQAKEGSLYETVQAKEPYVDQCLKYYLGRIMKCRTVEELHQVRDGVTPDCYSYSGYRYRHLKKLDYTLRACIGTKISRAKLEELEREVQALEEELHELLVQERGLNAVHKYEALEQDPAQLTLWSKAAGQLEKNLKRQEKLRQELKELEDGTLTAELKRRKAGLEEQISGKSGELDKVQEGLIQKTGEKAKAEADISGYEEKLRVLTEGFVPAAALAAEVQEALAAQSESAYRNQKGRELAALREREQEERENRMKARMRFNREYPSYDFSGEEQDNDAYDRVLDQCRQDFEPRYQAEFQKQCDLVYQTLRENVIATIHGDIKAAYRHAREINRLLARIRFSDSIYQIEILPAENENGQFFEMLTAKELDSKAADNLGFEGQMSLGEDAFYQQYEQKIRLLTEKFMPPASDQDPRQAARQKQEMERYADYRSYLTFRMYERVEDEHGVVKKNPVDEMAGRDSGGEGQNPKYVALLAGFAMLYMQQSSRDSKIRLVLLDEAFSKMDKERSEVCLRYARELELQLIVCVPDERLQSLIRNVDCVYGFRRHRNQISMMHIDKGDYLRMVEGEPDGGEEAERNAGRAVDSEDGHGELPGGETDWMEAPEDHTERD